MLKRNNMQELVFCSDGILRVKRGDKPLVPLLAFQKDKTDLYFMSSYWEENVTFEEGTTIGSFLDCLSPWIDFWSEYIRKDLKSYLAESKKPRLVKSDEVKMYAVLNYTTEVRVHSESNKNLSDFEDMNEFFNDSTPPTLKPFWDFDSFYKLTGYKVGEVEHYTLDYTPMNELADYLFFLSNRHIIHTNDFTYDKYGDKDKCLFNKDAFGIKIAATESKRGYTEYVVGSKNHNIREVIESFFWWFSSTPKARDEFNEYLKEELSEVMEDIDRDGVIDESSPIEVVDGDGSEEKPLKVIVAPNAFSSIISYEDRQQEKFDEAYASAKKQGLPIKIGKVTYAYPFEKRVGPWIVEEDNIE